VVLRGYGLNLRTGGGILCVNLRFSGCTKDKKYLVVQSCSRRDSQHGDILFWKYSAEIVTLVPSW